MNSPATPITAWRRTTAACARMRLVAGIALWRHGWLWPLAVLLLLCAGGSAVLCRLATERDQAALAQERAALASAQSDADRRVATARSVQFDPKTDANRDADNQALLASVLVPRDQVSETLRRLYKLAAQQQVVIAQAEFQDDGGANGIERLQVRVPVKASYTQLRRFVEALLRDLPNASLDGLSFRRNQVSEAQLEAQLRFSLWLQMSSMPAPIVAGSAHTAEAQR